MLKEESYYTWHWHYDEKRSIIFTRGGNDANTC